MPDVDVFGSPLDSNYGFPIGATTDFPATPSGFDGSFAGSSAGQPDQWGYDASNALPAQQAGLPPQIKVKSPVPVNAGPVPATPAGLSKPNVTGPMKPNVFEKITDAVLNPSSITALANVVSVQRGGAPVKAPVKAAPSLAARMPRWLKMAIGVGIVVVVGGYVVKKLGQD